MSIHPYAHYEKRMRCRTMLIVLILILAFKPSRLFCANQCVTDMGEFRVKNRSTLGKKLTIREQRKQYFSYCQLIWGFSMNHISVWNIWVQQSEVPQLNHLTIVSNSFLIFSSKCSFSCILAKRFNPEGCKARVKTISIFLHCIRFPQ